MIALCVLKLNPTMFMPEGYKAILGTEMNYWVLLFSSENELALRIGLKQIKVIGQKHRNVKVSIAVFLQANIKVPIPVFLQANSVT